MAVLNKLMARGIVPPEVHGVLDYPLQTRQWSWWPRGARTRRRTYDPHDASRDRRAG
jgi:hypothetical protein